MGSCEHDNESLGYIKVRELLYLLDDCQLFKNECAPRSYIGRFEEMS
jgi:hypothetical protein